ncbi:MAG: sugar transferase [Ignavibacteriales bacterium]|nr:MAG: sugar transferase [Ignavibacteriales bacterium]
MWRSSNHKYLAQFIDFLTVFFVLFLLYSFWPIHSVFSSKNHIIDYENELYVIILFLLASELYVLLFNAFKAYSFRRFTSLKKEFTVVIKVSFLGMLIGFFITYIIGIQILPRSFMFITFMGIFFALLLEKLLIFYVARIIRLKGENRKRILIIGTDHRCEQFIETVDKNLNWGLDIVGLISCDAKNEGEKLYGHEIIGTIDSFEAILNKISVQEVIITLSSNNFDSIRRIIEICEREGVQVRINSDFLGKITKQIVVDEIYGLKILSIYFLNQRDFELLLKRIIDIAGALFVLIIFSPLILVSLLLVFITDGTPLFYKLIVIGKDRKRFHIWKIRTMVKNADRLKESLTSMNEMTGPVFKIKKDPRILLIGKLLRKFSIDETPQLLNVLKGDLSLVGPRANQPFEFELFDSWQKRKVSIKPGLTCLWQINGRNKISDFNDWVKLDLEYIDNWSILLDFKILLKTIPVIILGKGV